jgi:exoribonuclease-2
MSGESPTENSLVLYKSNPARVVAVEDKIEIVLRTGTRKRVRNKDITLLHPGPIYDLEAISPRTGEIEEAWEMLQGEATTLAELAELAFGEYTPQAAWAAWELIADGLYFEGSPAAVTARDGETVAAERQAREARAAAEAARQALLERLRSGAIEPGDGAQLAEVERLAKGQALKSRIMSDLGKPETPEAAHRLLLRLGHWDETVNPHPARLAMPTDAPDLAVGAVAEESRRDLTHLAAYAIDDEGNQDPDDALSLEGDRLWVHVADVAALVAPDSELDLAARGRGANLYLPEGVVPMLPVAVTERLGLGLQPVSPALSFGLRLDGEGRIVETEIVPSWVRVQRLSYAEAQARLDTAPFTRMQALAGRFRARRALAGACELTLPEVSVKVDTGGVHIRPLPPLASRSLVAEAMLMAGEAAGRFALAHGIAFPYSTQPPPDPAPPPSTLAEMFTYRKSFKRSRLKSVAEPHGGLGLEVYAPVTSPLRRYLDLVAHQQLRASLHGHDPLPPDRLVERVGAAEALIGAVRRAERASNLHWKLVYLKRCRDWRGRGTVVDQRGGRGTVIIPELALEAPVSLPGDAALDEAIPLKLTGIDLPGLVTHFQT